MDRIAFRIGVHHSQACHSYDTPELIVNADYTKMPALENTNMPKLKLVAKGKVRDIYALPDEADSDKLLFVATDRISAFDIIMDNVRSQGRRVRGQDHQATNAD
jgi:hypothetical protein